MTNEEIRKEAEKYADEQWPTLVDEERQLRNEEEFDQRDGEVDAFIAGALWGARKMNEEAVNILNTVEKEKWETLARVVKEGGNFPASSLANITIKIRALMPAEDEK